jgi:hypothetical protein
VLIDNFRVTLSIHGDDLDPEHISELMGCAPTSAAKKGSIAEGRPTKGCWLLTIDSRDCGEDDDVGDVIKALLARLPSNLDFWVSLTKTYKVQVFCGLHLEANNRMAGIPAEISNLLSDRRLDLVFDIYFGASGRISTT